MEPKWLTWARQIQALAQSGLAYSPNPYDRDRFEQLRRLAAEIAAEHTGDATDRLEGLFMEETGYATPKVGVRAAVFRDGRILMVREVADGHRWTLPGGWADVNQTPAECTAREVWEESGFEVVVRKLAGVYDRRRFPPPARPVPFYLYKLFFLCDITGGTATPSLETSEVGFFAEEEIDGLDLSHGRVTGWHIHRMFEHHRTPDLPADFD
ncbi:NUDIX hydrolase [Caenispirillum bisanense]|uniref:ADP-ribose pyrophosphatase YjhB, NUDIX family n=1 Tax=Caenispirillum bisanense TaxID=414052 RepID=A0A286GBE9_9PROT|nr:NUDIX hydrolase N-terminal domain-containing protein [Caenispirillum bisanense]SOD92334.1 ADP-ribose pyrophosphatase YjhB, NUDIX family [Caenispirillum bisanense]